MPKSPAPATPPTERYCATGEHCFCIRRRSPAGNDGGRYACCVPGCDAEEDRPPVLGDYRPMVERLPARYAQRPRATMPDSRNAYWQGEELVDIPLREVRSWQCNGCGDCCSSRAPGIRTDDPPDGSPGSGLPMWVWGNNCPDDLYEGRFGHRMLIPLVPGDGELVPADAFATDADGEPYRAFECVFRQPTEDGGARCEIYPRDLEPDAPANVQRRPRNCGEFPVFSNWLGDAIIYNGTAVIPTGALPRCTWYGVRVVGPRQHTPGWEQRYEQQRDLARGAGDGIPVSTEQRRRQEHGGRVHDRAR